MKVVLWKHFLYNKKCPQAHPNLMENAHGVTTIPHTKLLIYQGFSAKVNKLKTNKEYIVSKSLTALVSIF